MSILNTLLRIVKKDNPTEEWMQPHYKIVINFFQGKGKGVWLVSEQSLKTFLRDFKDKEPTHFTDINGDEIGFDTDCIFVFNVVKIGRPRLKFISRYNDIYRNL